MKKVKGVKQPKVKSKVAKIPLPKGTHRKGLKGSEAVPKGDKHDWDPSPNLGPYLHKPKKKIGVKAAAKIVKEITSRKDY